MKRRLHEKAKAAHASLEGPVRTCLACNEKKLKKDLCRFAVNRQGVLMCDETCRLPGRGAYACRDNECIRRFLQNTRKLQRALRIQNLVVSEDLHAISRSG